MGLEDSILECCCDIAKENEHYENEVATPIPLTIRHQLSLNRDEAIRCRHFLFVAKSLEYIIDQLYDDLKQYNPEYYNEFQNNTEEFFNKYNFTVLDCDEEFVKYRFVNDYDDEGKYIFKHCYDLLWKDYNTLPLNNINALIPIVKNKSRAFYYISKEYYKLKIPFFRIGFNYPEDKIPESILS